MTWDYVWLTCCAAYSRVRALSSNFHPRMEKTVFSKTSLTLYPQSLNEMPRKCTWLSLLRVFNSDFRRPRTKQKREKHESEFYDWRPHALFSLSFIHLNIALSPSLFLFLAWITYLYASQYWGGGRKLLLHPPGHLLHGYRAPERRTCRYFRVLTWHHSVQVRASAHFKLNPPRGKERELNASFSLV